MSILSSVTSMLAPTKNLGTPSEECKQTKSDDRGDDKHKGREESKNDDREKQAKHDDRDREKQAKNDDHDREKQAKHDDHDREKQAKNDDHDREKQAKNDHDHEKQAKNDDHRDDHEKQAKNDDCHQQKDDCHPQKDFCEAKSSDDGGKGNICHSPGEALAKFDFSHGDLGSHTPDHSGDMQAALASMPSGHALDYAIGQMGPADHFDVGHLDVSHDLSHSADHAHA